jgi:phosphoribosylformimino-5-aminoimidazole carboxamide ribonucleotide (ProFAR) isomerase
MPSSDLGDSLSPARRKRSATKSASGTTRDLGTQITRDGRLEEDNALVCRRLRNRSRTLATVAGGVADSADVETSNSYLGEGRKDLGVAVTVSASFLYSASA